MAITRLKKEETRKLLEEKIKGAESVVFVNFHKLKVADSSVLRKNLRTKGMGYMVAKKTLIRLALKEAGVEGDLPELAGEIAIAYGTDAVLPVKEITDFQKKHKEEIAVAGGVLEGRFLTAAEMIALSKVPSREILLSQLVNVMNSPIQGFVGTLNGVMSSFVRVLDAVAKEKTA